MVTPAPPEEPAAVEVPIVHAADGARARGEAARLAHRVGFDDTGIGELVVCASELAANALEHGGPEASVSLVAEPRNAAVRLAQWDAGPGLNLRGAADRRRAWACDGVGLAGVGRLLDVVELRAGGAPGARVAGTRWLDGGPRGQLPHVIGVERPCQGQRACGDAVGVSRVGPRLRVAVVDGLGHGVEARAAALEATAALRDVEGASLERAVHAAHLALGATRGAALAVAELDLVRRELDAVVIGNVRLTLLGLEGARWSPAGSCAVLGHGRPGHPGRLPLKVERTRWQPGSLLCLASDGLSGSRLTWEPPRGGRHPDLLGLALERFLMAASDHDDASLALVELPS